MRSRAPRLGAVGLVSGALVAAVALSGPPTAGAAPVGSNGVINGCYKAKGKGKKKGALRVVKPGKPCKRRKGEKPIVWLAQGAAGTPGAPGSPGSPGGAGLSDEQIIALLELIQQQAGQIEQLTATLDAVCGQVSDLTTQSNALLTAIGDLGLNSILTGIGGLLEIPTLPAALDPLNCSA